MERPFKNRPRIEKCSMAPSGYATVLNVRKADTAIVDPGPRDGTKSSVPKWSNDTSTTMAIQGRDGKSLWLFPPSILK
ncbi:hypothetical protein JTE90_013588 [Oedothorax gibbosus]|uniref:Uncharacterized protein n=1 Tax=Oedothorax gibbosus TaxID=931172 RepID=A0AAV6VGC2_9ARAC|nr:hypothetical protein JTE90_013588 [Oedothorax gibbosus]